MQNQAMAKPLTPPQIRDAELPRSLRGFDVDATRELLANVAGTLAAVTRERDDLRKQVEGLSVQASENPTDAERLGAVLLMAKHTGDDLVAKATEEAAEIRAGSEQMRAEVERERAELAAKARAEADAMVSEAAATVESLGREAEELRQSIAARRAGAGGVLAVGPPGAGGCRVRRSGGRGAPGTDTGNGARRRAPGTAPLRIVFCRFPGALGAEFTAEQRVKSHRFPRSRFGQLPFGASEAGGRLGEN